MRRFGLCLLACALAWPASAGASGTITFRSATFQAPEISRKVTVVIDRDNNVGTASAVFSTIDGSAKAPGDYTSDTRRLEWMSGETTKTIELTVNDDGVREPNETFLVKLSDQDPTTLLGGYAQSTVLVVDSPGKTSFETPGFGAGEGSGKAVVTVTRTKGSSGPLTVFYETADGTARAGADYTKVTGAVKWDDGDTSPKTFEIPVVQDATIEGPETVLLGLRPDTSLTGALVDPSFSERASAVLTIGDDDTPAVARLRGSDLFALPSTGRCVKTRSLTVTPRNRGDVTLSRVDVKVNGKSVRRVTSQKSIRKKVVLKKLPRRGKFTVQAEALTSTGRLISIVRQYRGCAP